MNEIKIKYVYDDEENKLGHMESIELPDGEVIYFDEEKGLIDLEPVRNYIDSPVVIQYENNEIMKRGIITNVGMQEDAKAIFIDWDDKNG